MRAGVVEEGKGPGRPRANHRLDCVAGASSTIGAGPPAGVLAHLPLCCVRFGKPCLSWACLLFLRHLLLQGNLEYPLQNVQTAAQASDRYPDP